jgi:hypothetical protein
MLSAVAADGFESGNFDGGTEQWASGGWTVSGDASIQTNGPHEGNYHARLRRNTGDLQRTVDVSGLSDVTLQFWSRVESFEGSDQAHVRVSGDGVNWTTLQTFSGGDSDNQYRFHELAVPDLGDTLFVRFDAEMSAPNDIWYLDDIAVLGEPAVTVPTISISDAELTEGNSGTSQMIFTVTRSGDTSGPSSVDFTTVDGTAEAGSDYVASSGTLQFLAGETSKTIAVTINGDTQIEPDESFSIELSNPTNATIGDGTGVGTIRDDDAVLTISYSDFREPAALIAIGNVSFAGDRIRLSDTGLRQAAVWHEAKQNVSTAFETEFTFTMGPDGNALSFVIQNRRPDVLGQNLGYSGIPNSLAIEFDVRHNPAHNDPDDNHVSVQSLGIDYNSENHGHSLGTASVSNDMNDGAPHVGKIRYVGGQLQVFVDDLENSVLSVAVDLGTLLELDFGTAWVGFVAGGSAPHEILSWHFTPLADLSTIVGIHDAEVVEGDDGTQNLVFHVQRIGPEPVSLQWSTSEGSALAGSDFTTSAGTLIFEAGGPDLLQLTVPVHGDSIEEAFELLFVDLAISSGQVTLVDGRATGTILNDDTTISISDATATEAGTGFAFSDVLVSPSVDGLWRTSRGLEIGPDGNIYATVESGPYAGAVLRFDAYSGELIDAFATHQELAGAKDLEFGPDGHLYVTDNTTDKIVRFDGKTGEFMDVFVNTGVGGVQIPRTLVFGPDGNLYVASADTNEILRYQGPLAPNPGQFIDAFVAAEAGGLVSPTALTFGPDGTLYVASGAHQNYNNSILKYDGTTGQFLGALDASDTTTLALVPTAGLIFGPDLNGDGVQELYASNGDGPAEVLAFDVTTGALLEVVVPSGSGGLVDPKGLAFTADGDLLVLSAGTQSVLRYVRRDRAAIQLTLSSPSAVPVAVDWTTLDGTATAGSDYVGANGTIVFAPGQTRRIIVISTLDDAAIESDETFTVQLSNATNAAIDDGEGTGTILDDDSHPIPNDPLFAGQWQLHNTGQTGGTYDADMDLPAAWSVTTGSMSTVVAVLDSGIDYTHEDLYLNIWLNEGEIPASIAAALTDTDGDGLISFRDLNHAANAAFVSDLNGNGYIDAGDLLADPTWVDGVDTDGNGYVDDIIGWDFVDGDNDPHPAGLTGTSYHGTNQAGRIGAIGDNGIGMTGINWQIRMMPLRMKVKNPEWTVEDAAAAIDYAVDMGAPLSSNSWGNQGDASLEFHQELYDAIDRGRQAGHLFVAGLHNGSVDIDVDPAHWALYDLDNIFYANGLDANNQLYGHSWGDETFHVSVPTQDSAATDIPNNYGTGSGPSATTALLAGVAALVKSVHPEWGYAEIMAQIMATADPLPELAGLTITGGRVNAAAAVAGTSIVISDPSIAEGDAGTTDLIFTVTRRGDLSGELVLNWVTADGTAQAGSDYVAGSGTIQFLAGESEKLIAVQITGDMETEADETLFVTITIASGVATLADTDAQGTILNDEAPPQFVDEFAISESTSSGSVVSGSLTDTQSSDNVVEAIRESETGGRPSNRTSMLEHTWTFNVTGGDIVTFFVEAWHTASGEGDNFVFAFSTDGTNFTNMLTVTKTADDDTAQSFVLPAGISGTVYIRVTDTDRTPGNRTLDTLYIDQMFIRSESSAVGMMANLLDEDEEGPTFSV